MRAPITFQYVKHNEIHSYEDGRELEEEVLDHKLYNIYVNEVVNNRAQNIQLIPPPYYGFLRDKHSGVCDVEYKEEYWEQEVKPRLPSPIVDNVFPFQKEAIYRMITSRRCLNAASMGLGKTLQGIAAMVYYHKVGISNDLIICPGYLRHNWVREIKQWTGIDAHVITKAGKKDIEKAVEVFIRTKGIKVISYDMAANILQKLKLNQRTLNFGTIICDESHMIKDCTTKRYKFLNTIIKGASQVYLLTGTPNPNRNKELYAQFSLLQPTVFYNFRVFTDRYCDGHLDKFRHYDDRGASNLQELAYQMSKMVIRMRREDYLKDLPHVLRNRIDLEPKEVSALFKKHKNQFYEELAKLDTDKDAKFKLQALASQMFTLTAQIKIPPVVEYLESYIVDVENLEKTIIFCVHDTMKVALEKFMVDNHQDYIAISGKTAMNDRPGMIERFRTDPGCMFAILTVGSCSTGLTITPIRKMIFAELIWSPADLAQCEARINRIGGAEHLEYTYLICDHTLDEMVFNKLDRKTDLTATVIDNGKRYGDFEFDSTVKRQKTSTGD
jgi:SNF2 family DNA or RNA helicase